MSINKIYFLSNMSARKIRLPESKKYLLQNRKEISRRFFVIRFSLSLSASFFLSVFLQTLNSVFVLSLSISSTELYNCTRRYSWIARSNQLESNYFCLAFLFTFTYVLNYPAFCCWKQGTPKSSSKVERTGVHYSCLHAIIH